MIPAPARTEPFSFEGGLPLDATIARLLPPAELAEQDRALAKRELTLAQLRSGIMLVEPILLPATH